jgi:hypothetical protein
MSPSYESLRAELDEIVERYRAHLPHDGNKIPLTREEAVERIRIIDLALAPPLPAGLFFPPAAILCWGA